MDIIDGSLGSGTAEDQNMDKRHFTFDLKTGTYTQISSPAFDELFEKAKPKDEKTLKEVDQELIEFASNISMDSIEVMEKLNAFMLYKRNGIESVKRRHPTMVSFVVENAAKTFDELKNDLINQ